MIFLEYLLLLNYHIIVYNSVFVNDYVYIFYLFIYYYYYYINIIFIYIYIYIYIVKQTKTKQVYLTKNKLRLLRI